MERVTLSKSLDLSRIVYGMCRMVDDADSSVKHVEAKISACLEQGITSFDQADIYGDYSAEAILGKTLRATRSLRAKMEIITKCDIVTPCGKYSGARFKYYDTSAAHINSSVEASLINMGNEHIDLLLIHRPDPFMDHNETGDALDALVAAGKVGNIGVLNFKPWDCDLLQSGMKNPLVTNQIEMSATAHECLTNGDLAYHKKNGQHVMAWSPLGGGSLMNGNTDVMKAMDAVARKNGVDRTAVAVAWIMAHPAKVLPVMGTNNLKRIAGLRDAFNVEMDRITWFEIYTAALDHEVA